MGHPELSCLVKSRLTMSRMTSRGVNLSAAVLIYASLKPRIRSSKIRPIS
jgi:hypothetical protein